MQTRLFRTELLPNDVPVDIEACDANQLLNPPHRSRLRGVSVQPGVESESGPDWSLLHPAA